MARNTEYALDEKDKEILRVLQHEARLTNKELAAKVHLSTTPTYERVKRLERTGYITQYATILNAQKLNKGFTVFCSVKLRHINTERAIAFKKQVLEMPEVTECYNISGSFDFMLRVQSPDMRSYQQFLLNSLGRHDNIASLESTFVMEEIKHEYSVTV
ncbi:MAG: Lrp/AsnC family transcriptional regulator [Bacteroidales bacterium]|nr:Lrp/AsnC family transcriptional regulator [Muribaculaceae bacterium]MDO4970629.1 Lrp/AsnC family transcriptional regulator [Bacteroidales bacterium]